MINFNQFRLFTWLIVLCGLLTTIIFILKLSHNFVANDLTRIYKYPPKIKPDLPVDDLMDLMFPAGTSQRARRAARELVQKIIDTTPILDEAALSEQWGYSLHNLTYDTYVMDLLDIYQEFFLPLNQPPMTPAQILQEGHQTKFKPFIEDIKKFLSFLPTNTCNLTQTIHTVGLEFPKDLRDGFSGWNELNPGWNVEYWHDRLDERMEEQFKGTALAREFEAVKADNRVVTSDMSRYLHVLLDGGVYTDTDTVPRLPVSEWGKTYHIQPLPSLPHDVLAELQPEASECNLPDVILSRYYDQGDAWRDQGFPVRREMVQWTFYLSRGHPILLDVLGQALRAVKAERLAMEGSEWVQAVGNDILHLAGPATFTNAVSRYLIVKYGLTPELLPANAMPLRIGEILLLTAGAFAGDNIPEGVPVCSDHGFSGRWRVSDKRQEMTQSNPKN